MRLSLITICRNSEQTLGRTLASVKNQRRLPDEYIFIDGQSTDRTVAMIQAFSCEMADKNVSVICREQEPHPGEAGIPSAWNQGLRMASGDVIGLLNSDDWYEPTALEAVESCWNGGAAVDVISCPVRFMLPSGQEAKVFYPKSLPCFLPFQMPVPHPGLFISKRLYDAVGLYDGRYVTTADYDMVWRLYRAGARFGYVRTPQVNMELGGLANSSREGARKETKDIALRHGACVPLVWLAYWLRRLSGR